MVTLPPVYDSNSSAVPSDDGEGFYVYAVRDRVEANFKNLGYVYAGTIAKVLDDGTYDIVYDDGDFESGVSPELITPLEEPQSDSLVPYEPGDEDQEEDITTLAQRPTTPPTRPSTNNNAGTNPRTKHTTLRRHHDLNATLHGMLESGGIRDVQDGDLLLHIFSQAANDRLLTEVMDTVKRENTESQFSHEQQTKEWKEEEARLQKEFDRNMTNHQWLLAQTAEFEQHQNSTFEEGRKEKAKRAQQKYWHQCSSHFVTRARTIARAAGAAAAAVDATPLLKALQASAVANAAVVEVMSMVAAVQLQLEMIAECKTAHGRVRVRIAARKQEQRAASLTIVSVARMRLVRHRIVKLQAATKIQCASRVKQAKVERKKREGLREAAIKVQAIGRMKLGKKNVAAKRRRDSTIMMLQARLEQQSAKLVQKNERGRQGRRRAVVVKQQKIEHKKQTEAATVIQTRQRSRKCRNEYAEVVDERHKAATKLQGRFRILQAKKRVKIIKIKNRVMTNRAKRAKANIRMNVRNPRLRKMMPPSPKKSKNMPTNRRGSLVAFQHHVFAEQDIKASEWQQRQVEKEAKKMLATQPATEEEEEQIKAKSN